MNNLPILLAFAAFLVAGIVSLFAGLRRLRKESTTGRPVAWYKQISILLGIEFLLLAVVLLVNLGNLFNVLPHSLDSLMLVVISILGVASVGLVIVIVALFAMSFFRKDQRHSLDGL